jgi:hypothetical protein
VTTARRAAVEATITSAGVGGLAGALAGLAWGGLGGRLAMRILFLTSDERVRGLASDDAFEIGRFSADTLVLVVITTVLGTLCGFAYGLVRVVIPGGTCVIAVAVAVSTAAGAGAAIVHVDGIDFARLGPLWLAVGMFIALPAAWGATVVVLTERLLRPGALYASPPEAIDVRLGGVAAGAVAWLALAAVTAAGVADILSDLDHLA